ncbi:hypothetical protein MRX96_043042 [Rhipicephalus microplus]
MEVNVLPDTWTLKKVDYKLVKRAQWVTSDNNRTNESTKYIFRLTFDNCAIVEKRKENTTLAYTEGWELWVNDRFHRKEERLRAVRNYTFLLTTRHWAVVSKREGISGADALVSTELWVKNLSAMKNIITCYKEFMHVCNCDGHTTWYSASQCEEDESGRRSGEASTEGKGMRQLSDDVGRGVLAKIIKHTPLVCFWSQDLVERRLSQLKDAAAGGPRTSGLHRLRRAAHGRMSAGTSGICQLRRRSVVQPQNMYRRNHFLICSCLQTPCICTSLRGGIPGVACIKAIRTKMNPTARTLSQVLVLKSSQKWSYEYEYVDYTPIWKNNKRVRGFTSFNRSTGEKTTYTLHHIYKDCAIVNKTKNTKKRRLQASM